MVPAGSLPFGVQALYTSASGNTVTANVQITSAQALSDVLNLGLSSFNSNQFSVDANGFVSLAGGGLAIDQIQVQQATAPGVNPVNPDATGLMKVNGNLVAAHSIPIETRSRALNAYNIEPQISNAVAASDITQNGMSHFDSARFTINSNGFVSINGSGIGETITGDSGGALSPTGGNWNILGRSGSKTSGTLSTLTIKSPPYANAGGSGTSMLNSGEFVTGAFTRTVPLSAGLADGDLLEYVATSASAIVIQMQAGQVAHLGSTATTAGGTLTSTAQGDSISLRYQASTDDFWATSSIGIWILA